MNKGRFLWLFNSINFLPPFITESITLAYINVHETYTIDGL